MSKSIIGRKREKKILECFLESSRAEFLALYGRRRVGKTFLIRSYFQDKSCLFFQVTGLKDGTIKEHLFEFTRKFEKTFQQEEMTLKEPHSWMRAFEMLTNAIEKLPMKQKIVLFFDELPWLATKKSRLLQVIDYYWNTQWVGNPKIKLIVCGSAASWMISKIIKNKGGLHNRITKKIRLEPFLLSDSKEFLKSRGIKLNEKQILELHMVMGGVPYYLDYVSKGLSATQNIDNLCFTKDGILFDEFNNLFASLFKKAEIYENIVRTLAEHRNGIDRTTLLGKLKKGSGGRFNQRLEELEEAGFIVKFISYGNQSKGAYYRVIDEYVLFYLNWIEPISTSIRRLDQSIGYWESKSLSPAFKSWSGYAFESLCYKHLHNIRKALKIGVGATVGTWRHCPKSDPENNGAQIDLLFDRDDGIVTLCEMKYSDRPYQIDKQYAKNIENKIAVFQKQTKTNKQFFVSMITPNGLKPTMYSEDIISSSLNLDDLFIEYV